MIPGGVVLPPSPHSLVSATDQVRAKQTGRRLLAKAVPVVIAADRPRSERNVA